MPIYEYQCTACGHEFEVIQKISDRPIRKCEACARLKAFRKISQTSFVLKGEGWYATDYGNRKGAKAAEKGEMAASAPTESVKTDEKPSGGESVSKKAS